MEGIKVKMGLPNEEVEPEALDSEEPKEGQDESAKTPDSTVNRNKEEPEIEPELTEVPDEELEGSLELEDLDPEEEFWPGGPKSGLLQEWKKRYGDIYVTAVTDNQFVVWRAITRPEYREYMERVEEISQSGQVSQSQIQMMVEETISELCMLYPTYADAMANQSLAGLPGTISQQCLEASGFVALETRRL